MGQDPQFDLRVVRREQHRAWLGHEGTPDTAALGSPGRDILQIGVGGTQAAGSGQRLMERRMQPARFQIDRRRQRVDVSRLELGDRPVLQQLAGQLVSGGQLGQHVDVG